MNRFKSGFKSLALVTVISLLTFSVARADLPSWFWNAFLNFYSEINDRMDVVEANSAAASGEVASLGDQVASLSALVVLDNDDDVVGPAVIDPNATGDVWTVVDTNAGPFMLRMDTAGPIQTTLYYLGENCPGLPVVAYDNGYRQGLMRPPLAAVIGQSLYAGDTSNINSYFLVSYRDPDTADCINIGGATLVPLIPVGTLPNYQAPYRVAIRP